jgi:hypothetical protein
MADQRDETKPATQQRDYSGQRPEQPKPLKDLDSSPDDAEKVKGGARRAGDPCDGGE